MTTGCRGRGSCDSTYTRGGLCQARTHLDTPPREPRFSFLPSESGACPGRNMRGEETGTLDSHAPGFSWVGVAGPSVESALTSSWRKHPPRSFVTTACAVNGPPHVNPRLASVHMTGIQTKSRAREARRVPRPPVSGRPTACRHLDVHLSHCSLSHCAEHPASFGEATLAILSGVSQGRRGDRSRKQRPALLASH